jgi:hypothetical protein
MQELAEAYEDEDFTAFLNNRTYGADYCSEMGFNPTQYLSPTEEWAETYNA